MDGSNNATADERRSASMDQNLSQHSATTGKDGIRTANNVSSDERPAAQSQLHQSEESANSNSNRAKTIIRLNPPKRKRDDSENHVSPEPKRPKKLRLEDATESKEIEPTVLGNGDYTTTARKFVWQLHSSAVLGKPIFKTPKSLEHVEMRKREAESYVRVRDESAVVETTDGFQEVMFIKKAMYTGNEGKEKELRAKSGAAFKNFFRVYPAETPHKDPRHMAAMAKEKAKWEEKGLPWGRLVRFSSTL